MDDKERIAEEKTSVKSFMNKSISPIYLFVIALVVLIGLVVAIIVVSVSGKTPPVETTPEETTTEALPDFYLTPTEDIEIEEDNKGMAFTVYVLPGTETVDLKALVSAKDSFVVTDSNKKPCENGVLPITKDGESFIVIYGLNTVYRITVKFFSFFTVGFEGVDEKLSVKKGGKISAPTTAPTKLGYLFDGWDFDFSQPIIKDITVPAKWKAKTYTVTLNPNGGSVSPEKITVTYGENVEFPTPTRQGYKFVGWYDEDVYIPSGEWTIDSDKTLFAIWDIFDYRITYNPNGGTVDMLYQGVSYGESFLSPAPTRNGYSFCGWYYDGELVTSNVFSYSKDVEFVAMWAENTYNVQFITNGGNPIDGASLLYSAIATTVPVREGYTFGGWFFNESLDKSEIPDNAKNDLIVYAWWTEESKASEFSFITTESGVVITGYRSDRTVCVIPSYIGGKNVVGIGEGAFSGVTTLSRLTFPETVLAIGKNAFAGCTALQKINPVENTAKDFDVTLYGVVSLGSGAFQDCPISSILIPTTVTELSDRLFMGCDKLVTPGDISHITAMGSGVFSGCTSLSSVTLPEGITSLGDDLFRGCVSLTEIVLPNSVSSLGDGVFMGCSSLVAVTLPTSLTAIGDSLFEGCIELVAVDNFATSGKITAIGDRAFADCKKLTGIAIPTSVKTIGREAFLNCLELKTLTLPIGVNVIEDGVFMGCSYLQTLTVKGPVTTVGNHAFNGCRRLRDVTLTTPLTGVGESAFADCINLKALTLTDSLESLGKHAFSGCYSMTSVKISSKIREIPEGAFEGCTALSEVTWHSGIVKVGKRAFLGCRALALSSMPAYLETVEEEAFKGCSGILSLSFENRLYRIGSLAFADCAFLTDVTFRGSAERWKAIVDDGAFDGCNDLAAVNVTAGIVEDLASSLTVNFETQALFAIDSTLSMNGKRPAAVLRFKQGSLFYRNFSVVNAEGVASVSDDYQWKLTLSGETTDEFTFTMAVTVSQFDIYHLGDGGYIFLDLGDRFAAQTDLAKVTASLEITAAGKPSSVLYTASLGTFVYETEKNNVVADPDRVESAPLTGITILTGPDKDGENGSKKLFDGDVKEKFLSADRTPLTVKTEAPIVLASYSLVTSSVQYCYPGAIPMGWTLYGGKIGENGEVEWTEISRITSPGMTSEGMVEYNFDITSVKAYGYFKLEFDGTHPITLGEIQLFARA